MEDKDRRIFPTTPQNLPAVPLPSLAQSSDNTRSTQTAFAAKPSELDASSLPAKVAAPQSSSARPSEPGRKKRKANEMDPISDESADAQNARRNKLGYHRIAMACGHCRRRKIRCLPSVQGDPMSKCLNCIKLKRECEYTPVETPEPTIEKVEKPAKPTLKRSTTLPPPRMRSHTLSPAASIPRGQRSVSRSIRGATPLQTIPQQFPNFDSADFQAVAASAPMPSAATFEIPQRRQTEMWQHPSNSLPTARTQLTPQESMARAYWAQQQAQSMGGGDFGAGIQTQLGSGTMYHRGSFQTTQSDGSDRRASKQGSGDSNIQEMIQRARSISYHGTAPDMRNLDAGLGSYDGYYQQQPKHANPRTPSLNTLTSTITSGSLVETPVAQTISAPMSMTQSQLQPGPHPTSFRHVSPIPSFPSHSPQGAQHFTQMTPSMQQQAYAQSHQSTPHIMPDMSTPSMKEPYRHYSMPMQSTSQFLFDNTEFPHSQIPNQNPWRLEIPMKSQTEYLPSTSMQMRNANWFDSSANTNANTEMMARQSAMLQPSGMSFGADASAMHAMGLGISGNAEDAEAMKEGVWAESSLRTDFQG